VSVRSRSTSARAWIRGLRRCHIRRSRFATSIPVRTKSDRSPGDRSELLDRVRRRRVHERASSAADRRRPERQAGSVALDHVLAARIDVRDDRATIDRGLAERRVGIDRTALVGELGRGVAGGRLGRDRGADDAEPVAAIRRRAHGRDRGHDLALAGVERDLRDRRQQLIRLLDRDLEASIAALCSSRKPSLMNENVKGPPLGTSNANVPSAATEVITLGRAKDEHYARRHRRARCTWCVVARERRS
jgi:hypothetical protein